MHTYSVPRHIEIEKCSFPKKSFSEKKVSKKFFVKNVFQKKFLGQKKNFGGSERFKNRAPGLELLL